MVKFSTFDAPANVTVGSGGRMATADDVGVSKGIQSLGQSLNQASTVIRQREDKRSITQARAQFAEFEIEQEEISTTRQNKAGVGAPGYYEQTRTDYDTAFENMNANWNDVQRSALAERSSSSRTTALKGAVRFQSGAIVKADLGYVKTIQTGISRRLAKGEIDIATAVQEYSETLVDTNIPAEKQQELLVASAPQFRITLSDSLIANPDLGLQMLRAGDLSMYPAEELTKLKDNMVKAMINAGEKAQQTRITSEISSIPAAMAALEAGEMTPAQLEQEFKGVLSSETLAKLKEIASDLQRPFRTPQEQTTATAELQARYNQLGIERSKGKMKTTATLRELLRFQNYALEQVNQGFVNSGAIQIYNRDIEAITQKLIGKAVPGPYGTDWFGNTPFNHGNKRISDHVKDGGLGDAAHTGVARRFNTLLDENNIQPGDKMTPKLELQIDDLVDQAIVGDVRERVPATRKLTDVPNFILNNGGRTAGAPGQRNIKADRKIDTKIVMGLDDNTGQYWLRTVDKDGKDLVKAQPLTQDQALGKSPIQFGIIQQDIDPVSPSQKTIDETTIGTLDAPAPATPEEDLNVLSPDTNPDPTVSTHKLEPVSKVTPTATTPEFQTKLAEEIEDELFAVEELGAAPQDQDSTPGKVSIDLAPPEQAINPPEQAINIVQNGLVDAEGTGDDFTGITTGEGGITEARKADIERRKGRPLTDQQARNEAVREDSAALHDGMPGFAALGAEVQAAVLDLTYNLGVNKVLDPVEFKRLRTAIAIGDPAQILTQTMNTAVVDGKSVKGLALRRARMYNQANVGFRITHVEQLNDGTINYLLNGRVLHTFKRPRHKKSAAGKISVTSGAA